MVLAVDLGMPLQIPDETLCLVAGQDSERHDFGLTPLSSQPSEELAVGLHGRRPGLLNHRDALLHARIVTAGINVRGDNSDEQEER